MKNILQIYSSFTRIERVGFIGLSVLLLLLILLRGTLVLWIRPLVSADESISLQEAWQVYKTANAKNTLVDTNNSDASSYEKQTQGNLPPLPQHIDLNLADSITLVRLKGIGPVTAGRIVAWRARRGRFTNINQLRNIGSFSQKTFDTLKNHLFIGKLKKRGVFD